ncbi:MAG: hypothetical protein GC181_15880 [Bacteroidetes bacterium]|nr:hypothetical protein [Bacteroidota bacterium]
MSLNRICIGLILMFYATSAHPQTRLGVSLMPGFSQITQSLNLVNAKVNLIRSVCVQSGIYCEHEYANHVYFGLVFNYFGVQSSENWISYDINVPDKVLSRSIVTKQINCFSVPVYGGFKIGKFGFTTGIQSAILLSSNGREQGEVYVDGQVIKFNSDFNKLNIDRLDYGVMMGLNYTWKELTFATTFYYGLKNISKLDNHLFNWRIRSFNVGINYTIKKWGNE